MRTRHPHTSSIPPAIPHLRAVGSTHALRAPALRAPLGSAECVHTPVWHRGLAVVACAECGAVSFTDREGDVAPTVALARLFGQFDLVGSLPTLRAPADVSLLYRPPKRSAGRALDVFPAGSWFQVDEALWLSHDGDHLLLATRQPVVDHVTDPAS